MVGESNKGSSTLHFAWFNPQSYVTTTRNILSPFQGAQADIGGRIAVPITGMGPLDEWAHIPDVGSGPTNPAKKPKTSNISDDATPNSSNTKRSKTGPSESKKVKPPSSALKRERKNSNSNSAIPLAVCTCTGVARQCSRWGSGGWQSSCCTSNISEFPLPMSSTRPGSRVPGRKMSNGAFEKLFERLMAQGYDLTRPIDLKDHWAKHGTNKFVTIK